MPKKNKQFVVIGLGRFGNSVATTLYSMGHDVLAIDKDLELVEDIAEQVTHAVRLDATDEAAFKAIGLRNFDVAIVCIGGDIQASILVTMLCKERACPSCWPRPWASCTPRCSPGWGRTGSSSPSGTWACAWPTTW